MHDPSCYAKSLARDGFAIVPSVFVGAQLEDILQRLAHALAATEALGSIRSQQGSVYAARNVLAFWPDTAEIWRQPPLPALLAEILGTGFGLVRALYFDKPPERTWALPLHKDLTIAVCNNDLPSDRFRKPTRKAGVPHVEAPLEVLEAMLTARIHLDDMTDENGPLQVVPGSHRTGKTMALRDVLPRSISLGQGDVMLMRPLLVHGSITSKPGTRRHRRILHLEFAGARELPDGFVWHNFIPG